MQKLIGNMSSIIAEHASEIAFVGGVIIGLALGYLFLCVFYDEKK